MGHSRSRGIILAILGAFLVSSTVHALANRVFVSARSGNDANTCDNILAPCQTFAGAVMKVNPGGEAIVLDSGGYGPVTTTQSLTIEAPPGVLAFVHPPSGNAITVNGAPTDEVILRGLVLNGGTGHGILVTAVGALHIENCVVSGFAQNGIAVGIAAAGSSLFVKDTIARQNGLDGVVVNRGRASIDHCRFEGNGYDGVQSRNADVTVRDSVAAGNTNRGFEALALSSEVTTLNVYQCLSTNNGNDGLLADNAGTGVVTVRVANSSISENSGIGLHNAAAGSVVFESLVNNFVRGNTGGDTSGTITSVAAK